MNYPPSWYFRSTGYPQRFTTFINFPTFYDRFKEKQIVSLVLTYPVRKRILAKCLAHWF